MITDDEMKTIVQCELNNIDHYLPDLIKFLNARKKYKEGIKKYLLIKRKKHIRKTSKNIKKIIYK